MEYEVICSDQKLKELGSRLKVEILRRNEPQAKFASRIGVSVPTLRKMIAGDPTVKIGSWSASLEILGRSGDLDLILAPPEDLFAKYDVINKPARQRASGKKL
jgi:transcriptional regulator with XRE-family HTH domain